MLWTQTLQNTYLIKLSDQAENSERRYGLRAFLKFQLLELSPNTASECKSKEQFCFPQTRIFVTREVGFLPEMDQIILLQDGRISEVRFLKPKSRIQF